MRRREFVKLIGGSVLSWPLAARAQPSERVKRIGVLMAINADDPESKVRIAAFVQSLRQLGWIVGQNVAIEYHWAGAMPTASGITQRNWLRSLQTSFCLMGARPSHRCYKRPEPFQSYSQLSLIRSVPATSIVCPTRAAMPPALPCSTIQSERSGWSYLKKLTRV